MVNKKRIAQVNVSLEWYKWFYRYSSIDLEFEDGEEESLEGPNDNFGSNDNNEVIDATFDYLIKKGYTVNKSDIECSVDEHTEDD